MDKILLVDDDEVDRLAIKRSLSKAGFEATVFEAKNATDGLKQIKKNKFDCVLLDYRLPDKNGLEVLEELLDDETKASTPFIIVTGQGNDELSQRALKAGAQDILSKDDMPPAYLAHAIINAVKRQELVLKNLNVRDELKQQANYLKTIMNTMVDGLVVIDNSGIILEANQACCAIFGYTNQELTGQNIKMLMTLDNYKHHDGYISKYLKTGKGQILGVGPREVKGLGKDGIIIDLELAIETVTEKGHQVFVGSLRDITLRKKAEEAAINFGRIIEDSLNEIIIFDDDTLNVVFANRGAQENLGYTLKELKKLKPWDINPNRTPENVNKLLKPLLTGKKAHLSYETKRKRKDGTIYIAEVHVSLAVSGGRPVIVTINEDVTEKKAIAEQLRQSQKMEAVGQLTGGIAHDFNNLLTAMQGGIMLAEMEEISDAVQESLNISLSAVKKGADLTQRLLAFSRTQTLKQEVVDINDLVRDFEPLLKRTLGDNIEIKTILLKQKAFVNIDISELENSILNLSVNARDAMVGGGKLTLEIERQKVTQSGGNLKELKPGDYIIVSVSDNGSGMPPEIMDKIFEPFFTTKDEGKGTGLGLSSVYGFVKQSGGQITVYSEADIGTTFKLYFPGTEKLRAVKTKKKKTKSPHRKATGKILLVEDNEVVRDFATQALKIKGYTVLVAENGPEAMELMEKNSDFDLLLTDIVLPKGMTGMEIGKKFEKMFPQGGIIYSSGFTGKAIEKNHIMKDGKSFLSKPYDLDNLYEMISSRIQNKKS